MEDVIKLKKRVKFASHLVLAIAVVFSPISSRGGQVIVHTVAPGETLSTILDAHGIKHLYGRRGSVVRIAAQNSHAIINPDRIRPGQKLSFEIADRSVASEKSDIVKPQSTPGTVPSVDDQVPNFVPYSQLHVAGGLTYSAFEGLQFSNGTRAKLLSGLSPSVSLKWKQVWTETVFTSVSFDLRSLALQPERAGVAIHNASLNESSLQAGIGKSLNRNLNVGFDFGIQNAVFYRGSSSGGLELFQVPIFLLHPSLQLTIFEMDPFSLHIRGGATYFGSSTYDGSPIRSGLGFDGALGLHQVFKNSVFGCDFGYASRTQDTEFLKFTQKDVGLNCALSWGLR